MCCQIQTPFARSWGKIWGKLGTERGQGFHGPGEVEKAQMRVQVAREIGRAVAHGALGHLEGNAVLGQEGAEGMAQGVDIRRAALGVHLGNARECQILVEHPRQLLGKAKEPLQFCPASDMRLQFLGQFARHRHLGPPPGLLVSRVKHKVGCIPGKHGLGHRQASQFSVTKASQGQRFIDECALLASGVEFGHGFLPDMCGCRPPISVKRLVEGTRACGLQEPLQLFQAECAAWTPCVRPLISL